MIKKYVYFIPLICLTVNCQFKNKNVSEDAETLLDSAHTLTTKVWTGKISEDYLDTALTLINKSIEKDTSLIGAWEGKLTILSLTDKDSAYLNTISNIINMFPDYKLYFLILKAKYVEENKLEKDANKLYKNAYNYAKKGRKSQKKQYYCLAKIFLLCKLDYKDKAYSFFVDTCSNQLRNWDDIYIDNGNINCEKVLSSQL